MTRCLKTFFYTLFHDRLFYFMLVIVALLSLGICSMNMESFKNHSMHKDWSEKEYMVKYEEEDPYLVAQNNNLFDFTRETPKYGEASISNSSHVSGFAFESEMVLFFALLIYQCSYCGRLFKDGVIRNLVVAGISKTKVFLSSLVISLCFLSVFTGIYAITAILGNLAMGFHMIIYWPSYLSVLAGLFLLLILMSAISLTLLFLSQNPMLTLILGMCLTILFVYVFPAMIHGKLNSESAAPYLSSGSRIRYESDSDEFASDPGKVSAVYWQFGDKEYEVKERTYLDISGMDERMICIDDGQRIDMLDSSRPNPDYVGDTYCNVMRFLMKSNAFTTCYMLPQYGYYPLVRDGVLLSESILSLFYIAVVISGGCIIAKKRNIT